MNSTKTYEMGKYLFHEGTNFKAYELLGSFLDGDKTVFRVWAPNAKQVYVTGEFCDWEPYVYEASKIDDAGLYECEISGLKEFDAYKYVFITEDDRTIFKSDPYAKHFETRPNTSSKIYNLKEYEWKDEYWMKNREIPFEKPMNIYEVHLGSWLKNKNGEFLNYRDIAHKLVDYVKKMNYTHIEVLPIMEHPFDQSWGYQVTGYYAPSSRHGLPEDFMFLVDLCHTNDIGVILDWVPGHFPKDESGLFEFDGGYVYEYSDHLKMEHKEWGTRVFDYGRNEVISFLISNADYWINKYHIDGLRVDAVSSMLYLDYCRNHGEWRPNIYGGNGNLEVIEFFKKLNNHIHNEYKGVMMIAEESTSWPKITHSIQDDGLGFDFKWNMGWMNDSLKYFESDPFFRSGIHNNMTFSMTYAFSEKYILALSHDEVVHGKKSIFNKATVPFDDKFNSLRAFMGYMFGHPGKKLNFMGVEISQVNEWNNNTELDWNLLDFESHKLNNRYFSELNKVYKKYPQFWDNDQHWEGFRWHIVDDSYNNVFVFSRIDKKGNEVLVISNFSSQFLEKYKIGVPENYNYKMLLNSDAKKFGGTGFVNRNFKSIKEGWNGFDNHICISIPGYTTMYLIKK